MHRATVSHKVIQIDVAHCQPSGWVTFNLPWHSVSGVRKTTTWSSQTSAHLSNCKTCNMVKVKCPFPDCTFQAENDEPVVTAALLNIHAAAHTATAIAPSTSARADKLKRPSVLLAGTGEEWAYFVTRWNEYRDGTKLTGADIVAQLLECCDEDLRRDLTRAAGGTLTGKGEAEVLAAIKNSPDSITPSSSFLRSHQWTPLIQFHPHLPSYVLISELPWFNYTIIFLLTFSSVNSPDSITPSSSFLRSHQWTLLIQFHPHLPSYVLISELPWFNYTLIFLLTFSSVNSPESITHSSSFLRSHQCTPLIQLHPHLPSYVLISELPWFNYTLIFLLTFLSVNSPDSITPSSSFLRSYQWTPLIQLPPPPSSFLRSHQWTPLIQLHPHLPSYVLISELPWFNYTLIFLLTFLSVNSPDSITPSSSFLRSYQWTPLIQLPLPHLPSYVPISELPWFNYTLIFLLTFLSVNSPDSIAPSSSFLRSYQWTPLIQLHPHLPSYVLISVNYYLLLIKKDTLNVGFY